MARELPYERGLPPGKFDNMKKTVVRRDAAAVLAAVGLRRLLVLF